MILLLKDLRTEITQGRMAPTAMVKRFDAEEQVGLCVTAGRVDLVMDQLAFQFPKEAFHGRSWSFLSTVAGTGPENGNPPAMVRMSDGRLCCVYGNREFRRIEAKTSVDQGETWSESVVLRDDFQADVYGDADLGYPRVAQRADGKLVVCYYWATAEMAQQHIAATIWDLDA